MYIIIPIIIEIYTVYRWYLLRYVWYVYSHYTPFIDDVQALNPQKFTCFTRGFVGQLAMYLLPIHFSPFAFSLFHLLNGVMWKEP